MAARLTDKQKKKIIADYVQLGSYNATAKVNGVSLNTVKKIVQGNADIAEMCNQKKDENTADILAYMESQKGLVCEIHGKGLLRSTTRRSWQRLRLRKSLPRLGRSSTNSRPSAADQAIRPRMTA